jgi:hypothetical protein
MRLRGNGLIMTIHQRVQSPAKERALPGINSSDESEVPTVTHRWKSHKIIPYKNEEKEYAIKSSHPELMDVKDSVVDVPAGADGKLKLSFATGEERLKELFTYRDQQR